MKYDEVTSSCRPDATTATIIVECLSNADEPRINDAKSVVDMILPDLKNNIKDVLKVQTALLKAHRKIPVDELTKNVKDNLFNTVERIYRFLSIHDLMAMNAYLDACCHFRHFRNAFQEFDENKKSEDKRPDVATCMIIISAMVNYYN